ncbi:FkbM family methyltransferase [Schlesneria sp. T3-172]|uniref:FkbM family methyltransferase n=1 Tax=Schlesneria sphaerica TaxID=3373610 RepID=UPI0037C606B7
MKMPYGECCGIKVRDGALGAQDCDVVGEVVVHDGYKLGVRNLTPWPVRYVIDIGAHIGTFAKMFHLRSPAAKIVCVEVCPENIDLLKVNTALIADVEQAACTYEAGEVRLHNCIKAVGGTATGGSVVTSVDADADQIYWNDDRPIRKLTLEEIVAKYDFPRIDCLKLDCEGSEFSILRNTTLLPKIGFICGEYHGRERWERLRAEKFADWGYCELHCSGDLGTFHLQNPAWDWDLPEPRPRSEVV